MTPMMPNRCLQCVVVTSGGWDSRAATARMFERSGRAWRLIRRMRASIGSNGMAWGIGIRPVSMPGPAKVEGDNRSPAGIFRLGDAYGYAADPPAGSMWPYRQTTRRMCCVDDPRSRYYNRVMSDVQGKDWKTAEKMLRADILYKRVIVVGHNEPPAMASKGSCIFIHVWRGRGAGTAGCTAISGPNIERMLAWLEPSACPVLIQMPLAIYSEVRKTWELP